MSNDGKLIFVDISPASSSIFEVSFWGGIPTFHFEKWSSEGSKLGHFWYLTNEKVVLSAYQNLDNSWTKIASAFVESSIESSENRAFDRDLNEGASIFRSYLRVEILKELWNRWNTPILAQSKIPPEHQKLPIFLKMRFDFGNHRQSTQLAMFHMRHLDGLPKIGVSAAQTPKIMDFYPLRQFLI